MLETGVIAYDAGDILASKTSSKGYVRSRDVDRPWSRRIESSMSWGCGMTLATDFRQRGPTVFDYEVGSGGFSGMSTSFTGTSTIEQHEQFTDPSLSSTLGFQLFARKSFFKVASKGAATA